APVDLSRLAAWPGGLGRGGRALPPAGVPGLRPAAGRRPGLPRPQRPAGGPGRGGPAGRPAPGPAGGRVLPGRAGRRGRGRAHLGLIEEGPMATQLKEDFTEATRWRRRPRPTFAWVAQVTSGVLLLILLTVHMVAQHFVVEGGLRTYADVVAWIRNPVVFAVEALLLVCVT